MPRDLKRISQEIREYIRSLDREAFERLKETWITESLGTEEFQTKTSEEVLAWLREKLPEENISPGPWLDSLLCIAKQLAIANLYANSKWPDKLFELYMKHGVKE